MPSIGKKLKCGICNKGTLAQVIRKVRGKKIPAYSCHECGCESYSEKAMKEIEKITAFPK